MIPALAALTAHLATGAALLAFLIHRSGGLAAVCIRSVNGLGYIMDKEADA